MQMPPFDLLNSDRKLAILIDPDKHSEDELMDFASDVDRIKPDYVLLGGSLIFKSNIDQAARILKASTSIPLILFPGHFTQLTDHVDGVLVLSLISGRNPDLLIGQHVLAAPKLKEMKSQKISTGYMLVDGGRPTSVSYMSNTQPIPKDKADIALCTAQAGEIIGMQVIYMDAGSGATLQIPHQMVKSVSQGIDIPLIIGGGIKSLGDIEKMWDAGANLVVIGNALEDRKSSFSLELAQRSTS